MKGNFIVIGELWPGSYGHELAKVLRQRGDSFLGIEVSGRINRWAFVDDFPFIAANALIGRIGGPLKWKAAELRLRVAALQNAPATTLCVGMPWVSVECLRQLRRRGPVVVFFNDDLETKRGRPARWMQHAQAVLQHVDLLVTQRPHRTQAIRKYYSGPILFQDFAYVPEFHRPIPGIAQKWDVSFVGNYDVDRLPFVHAIAETGHSLAIWGPRWPRHVRRPGLSFRGTVRVTHVAEALCSARLGLCLVRHNNFDQQVMRTFEVPACGSFLLAERTQEHQTLFEEGKEAEFFADLDELKDKVRHYARRDKEREQVAKAGYAKVTSTPNTIADRFLEALNYVEKGKARLSDRSRLVA